MSSQIQERNKCRLSECLEDFRVSVESLDKNPSLETALDANIKSIRAFWLISDIERMDSGIDTRTASQFTDYTGIAFGAFKRMIEQNHSPDLDHIRIYQEQMSGRLRRLAQFNKYNFYL